MKALDLYWMKDEWTEITEVGVTLRDDAPEEAKESYRRYLEQIKDGAAI